MAQAVVAAIGGVIILVILVRFILSFWRKPPRDPGSNDPWGGMPPGGGPLGDGQH